MNNLGRRTMQMVAVASGAVVALTTGSTAEAAISLHGTKVADSPLSARPASPSGATEVLRIIDSIPEGAARRGPAATKDWLEKNYRVQSRAFMDSVGKCVGAIAVLIGSNAAFFGKVLKIKSAIKLLGGFGKMIEQVRDRTKRGEDFLKALGEVFEGAGAGLGVIALDIVSAQGIADNCF